MSRLDSIEGALRDSLRLTMLTKLAEMLDLRAVTLTIGRRPISLAEPTIKTLKARASRARALVARLRHKARRRGVPT